MAAKRLAGIRQNYQEGTGFDSNEGYSIEWDVKPKLIPGMKRALEYMVVTGLDHIAVKCRCDYAYGAEGYRKRTGEVLVPPYSSLSFEIDLVNGPSA
uniref:peptidylprolyl isomerase n=1 Tax=Amphora coffeiformis TaxID=265554 RepID=A0A7S3L7L2_9STRA